MKLLLCLMIILMSFNVMARDGSSGCGPGWYLFKENSLLSSSLRSTTNGILLPTVTLGMTFGTSNCTKHSIAKMEKESLKFITDNYYEVAFDSVKGQGAFITSYTELLGCQKVEKQFKHQVKKYFEKIYDEGQNSPEEVLKQTYNVILTDPTLAQSCFQV